MRAQSDSAAHQAARRTRVDAATLLLRREAAELREQLGKLAALVDHYHAAYQDTQGLLARRERELAVLLVLSPLRHARNGFLES
jgi:hypothetical protein